jgi:hypothetical protein
MQRQFKWIFVVCAMFFAFSAWADATPSPTLKTCGMTDLIELERFLDRPERTVLSKQPKDIEPEGSELGEHIWDYESPEELRRYFGVTNKGIDSLLLYAYQGRIMKVLLDLDLDTGTAIRAKGGLLDRCAVKKHKSCYILPHGWVAVFLGTQNTYSENQLSLVVPRIYKNWRGWSVLESC